MLILAHRAYTNGINKREENQLESVRFCLDRGWGVETDIRRTSDSRFYISHEAGIRTEINRAESFCAIWRQYPELTIALNIKELGYERELIAFLAAQGVLRRLFLFDMELLETDPGTTARLFRNLDPSVKLAARVSDRGESINRALSIDMASVIWVDEFDTLWLTKKDVSRLKATGKQIYAISPEIHGFGLEVARERWQDFVKWQLDGVCTDYPGPLQEFIERRRFFPGDENHSV